jgi:hypothetical protein
LVDEMLKKVLKNKLRQRGPCRKLSDAEVITMEIVGESNDKVYTHLMFGVIAIAVKQLFNMFNYKYLRCFKKQKK